jgi:hypothetical protein
VRADSDDSEINDQCDGAAGVVTQPWYETENAKDGYESDFNSDEGANNEPAEAKADPLNHVDRAILCFSDMALEHDLSGRVVNAMLAVHRETRACLLPLDNRTLKK